MSDDASIFHEGELFHYTSLETLLSIIETSSIWATSVRYLNDISERLHYFDLLEGGAEQTASAYSRLPFFSWIMLEVQQQKKLPVLYQPFVTSFTTESNLLPLWLAYCPRGNGVSIGFRTKALQSAWVSDGGALTSRPHGETPLLQRVEYLDDVREDPTGAPEPQSADNIKRLEMLDRLVRDLHRQHPEAGVWGRDLANKPPTLDQLNEAQAAIRRRVRERSVSVKRRGFMHETESRLIISTMESNHKLMRYRATSTTVIPYVPICLPTGEALAKLLGGESLPNGTGPHFISKVVVGPGADTELTKAALESLFGSKQLSITVETSGLPYRQI